MSRRVGDRISIGNQEGDVQSINLRTTVLITNDRVSVIVPNSKLVRDHFTLTPREIIEHLDLRRPIYMATAAYGHFGRSGEGFTWEQTDKAEDAVSR